MSKDKKTKKKKEKVRYIDDGRSLADMSAVGGGKQRTVKQRSTMKEQATTYFNAVKLMFFPMLITMGIITLAFGIVWLILTLMTH